MEGKSFSLPFPVPQDVKNRMTTSPFLHFTVQMHDFELRELIESPIQEPNPSDFKFFLWESLVIVVWPFPFREDDLQKGSTKEPIDMNLDFY